MSDGKDDIPNDDGMYFVNHLADLSKVDLARYNAVVGRMDGKDCTAMVDQLGWVFYDVKQDGDEIIFTRSDGAVFKLAHVQDCCESVYIESITGDLADLAGSPLLLAEESWSDDDKADESGTWTFYKFATIKGYVDIRFHGTSNEYYSESASWFYVKGA